MTTLHLDSDEWDNILFSLKKERDQSATGEPAYADYLNTIILKIEIAFAIEAADAN